MVVLFDGPEVLVQILERGTVLIAARHIRGELLELFDFSSYFWIIVWILNVSSGAFTILFFVHLCSGIAYDMDFPREIAIGIETK